ncbi:hypothetical protein N2152v2_005566 [Parachlorella kessleri]
MELCSELQLVFESAVAGLEAEATECTAAAAAIQRLTTGSSDTGSGSLMDLGTQHCSEQHCAGEEPTNSQLELESRDTGAGLQELRRQGQLTMPKDLQDIAKELREAVLLPMHLPHLFTGIRRPQCNLMFHGLPGTGKTMLVEKIAAEAAIPLLVISPSAILSKWSGDSEKSLRAVFEAAAQMAPAIVFIDEIDSLAPARFDRKIKVPIPDLAARQAFFMSTVQQPEISSSLSNDELSSLAHQTEGCTGSDLSVICRDAAMAPLRQLMREVQLQQRRAKRRDSRPKVEAAATASFEGVLSLVQTPLVRDIAAAAFAVLGAKLLVRFFYMLEAKNLIDQNVSRKLVHTLAGPLFVVTWPLFSADPYARCFAAIVPILNIGRLLAVGYGLREDKRAVKAMSRTGDPTELLRGPLYYTIVLLAATVVYWRDSSVGLIVLSLMCGGDGLADIVGRRWGGTNRLPWNPAKSWAGSTAMFCGGLGFALALISYFCQLGYLECEMPSMALTVAAIALAATVIESLPLDSMVDDNLTVPGVAAFLGIMMLQVAVEFL